MNSLALPVNGGGFMWPETKRQKGTANRIPINMRTIITAIFIRIGILIGYALLPDSTTDFIVASPFSNWLPTILSQSMNRPIALHMKLLLPDMLQVISV